MMAGNAHSCDMAVCSQLSGSGDREQTQGGGWRGGELAVKYHSLPRVTNSVNKAPHPKCPNNLQNSALSGDHTFKNWNLWGAVHIQVEETQNGL